MITDTINTVQLNNLLTNIETVKQFIYLGYLITENKKAYSTIADSHDEPEEQIDRPRSN